MFALFPGYSILKDIMHSLNLSAVLEKKNTHRQKKIQQASVNPTSPLD